MDEYERICERLTRDFLRPALAAAGVEDVEQYKVTWVREDVLRPGIFQQEGDGTCAVGYSCPPWSELFEGPFYQVTDGSVEVGKPCLPITCGEDVSSTNPHTGLQTLPTLTS